MIITLEIRPNPATFTYDSLNRITQAYSAGTYWGETFSTDPWSNLNSRSPANGRTNYEPLSAGVLNSNRLSGFGYDAAGNMTSNGGATYTYDAENRLLTTAGVTYAYDGDGNRVKKSSGTLYWGVTLAESDLTATASSWKEYIFFAGKRVARREAIDDKVHYYYSDHLGSTSLVTDEVGTMTPCTNSPTGYTTIPTGEEESDFYPYGGEMKLCDRKPQNYKFTGKERDAESGLDNFEARYLGSSLGRFMSPDPLGGHLENPQSLNKYAYVLNNPLSLTDPTGLDSYLSCTQTKDNASTCQSQTVGYDKNGNAQTATVQGVSDKNGNFTATQIGNDANGNLVDKTTGTGSYTASVNGSGVQFSNNGGQSSSTGVFVNGTPQNTFQDAGWANGNALTGFTFTLTNSKLEAGQTEAGFFSFQGTPDQAGSALQRAGFKPRSGIENGNEYRSPGSFWRGANSGHFIVNPRVLLDPGVTVPAAGGDMHFGEHNPYSPFGWAPHISEANQ